MSVAGGDQLRSLLAVSSVRSDYSFSWFDKTVTVVPARLRAALNESQLHAAFEQALADVLYTSFYCHGKPQPQRVGPAPAAIRSDAFRHRLIKGLDGNEGWEGGWTQLIESSPDRQGERTTVTRHGLTLWVEPERVRTTKPPLAEVRMPRVRPNYSPGFLFLLGERDIPPTTRNLLRIYWNLSPAIAADWFQETSLGLDKAGIGHHLKVLDEPSAYVRCDAGVLYVALDDYASALPVLQTQYRRVAERMHLAVPALTLELAPGVGVAIAPRDGNSFGQHRCRTLAKAQLAAHGAGATGTGQRFDHIVESLAASGVDIVRPYRLRDDADPAFQPWNLRHG